MNDMVRSLFGKLFRPDYSPPERPEDVTPPPPPPPPPQIPITGNFLVGMLRGHRDVKDLNVIAGDLLRIQFKYEGARFLYTVTKTEKYLGVSVSNLESLPGEDWLRGNDLHDGRNSMHTFERIMEDVAFYEKNGHKWRHVV